MHPTLLLFSILTWGFLFITHIAGDVDEASLLLSFKSNLVDPIHALHDWNPSSSPVSFCNWTGVQCDPSGSTINSLDLSHMNLTGDISTADSLRLLPNLSSLNLCCNSFSTTSPSFSFPRSLRHLDISDNCFSGHFPSIFSQLPDLRLLNASGNNFAGTLPHDVANATALETLDLRGGFFSGSIPLPFTRLERLRFLGLSGNNLTGNLPPELGRLSSLETLIIGYNGFDGNIPTEIGNLTNLQYLDMAIGEMGGRIPAELGKLRHLGVVYLYRNKLEGEIPEEIGNASSLGSLDLSDNQLSGEIPAGISRLSDLQLLNLMCNRLEGSIPAGIGSLPELEVLELWNNSLTGPLPETLGQSSPLQWLDVSSNSLSRGLPAGLCDSGNLTKLILFNNAFSGRIPPGLSSCHSLVRVRMHNNKLNGTIPAGFGRLPSLQRLELAGNELAGEIPDDISTSASLSFIDISHNRLQLSLPSDILFIPTLQTLLAADNQLTGEVPIQFQDCPSLSALDLSSNRLSGVVPSSLAACERLVSLNLRGNRFTGEIPSAISAMPTLSILDLSDNLLTGSIPSSFGSSQALETLNLAYNRLSGPVPQNGLLRTINPDDLAGNPGLCGGVLPPCLGSGDSSPSSGLRKSHIKHIAAGWAAVTLALFAIAVIALAARRWYMSGGGGGCCNDEESGAWPWRLTAFQRVSFTSADVLACIKESNVIGMGASGIVYRAEVPQGQVVAVKKLWRSEGAEKFVGEASLLGRLRHRNIVRMLGYLHNESEAMIVYEYMPNGSLWEALHGQGAAGRAAMVDWVVRYNVAVGVAQGLAYLHHDCHPPVIHRDVKSSNILLDVNFEARIADFGLARTMVGKEETVSGVAGSYGYIAPEYGYTLKVDERTDVYSIGVVLMELVTGRRPVEAEFGEGMDIVGWVRGGLRGSAAEEALVDGGGGGQCKHVQEEMMLVLRVAVLCAARSPKDRPSMRDVVTMLGEGKPRRKSSVAAAGVGSFNKDKPVFSTSPEADYV